MGETWVRFPGPTSHLTSPPAAAARRADNPCEPRLLAVVYHGHSPSTLLIVEIYHHIFSVSNDRGGVAERYKDHPAITRAAVRQNVGAGARAIYQRRGCADGEQAQELPETGDCCLRLAAEPPAAEMGACCFRLAAGPPAASTPRGFRLAATGCVSIRRGFRLAAAAHASPIPSSTQDAQQRGARLVRSPRLRVAGAEHARRPGRSCPYVERVAHRMAGMKGGSGRRASTQRRTQRANHSKGGTSARRRAE